MGSSWWCQTDGAGQASLSWKGLVMENSQDSARQRNQKWLRMNFWITGDVDEEL